MNRAIFGARRHETIIVQAELLKTREVECELEQDVEIELAEVELERKRVKNLRKHTDMLEEIIVPEAKVEYRGFRRSRFEVLAGSKLAIKKGAPLDEVKVYNLLFTIKSPRLDASYLAAMYRPQHINEEWILLVPNDTRLTIENERRFYLNKATELVLSLQMDPDEQSNLIENLNYLYLENTYGNKHDVAQRCAQSLMHEYGHILHWRMFDALGLDTSDPGDVYLWFFESGYAENLASRYPKFIGEDDDEKVHLLKEGLVEDYRISLNQAYDNGMFILPNAITFRADFQMPELMYEGVEIMKRMLEPAINKRAKIRTIGFSSEINRVEVGELIHNRANATEFVPGVSNMTRDDHLAVVERLKQKHGKKTFQTI